MQVLSIILAILAFGVLVIVHEFGHFITAKRGGVQVNEFWIGMGPTILKHEYHGTMYCLKLLPFGGACVMEGEDGESESEHAFGRARLRRRILIVAAGALMNFLIGFVILLFVGNCFLLAVICTTHVLTPMIMAAIYPSSIYSPIFFSNSLRWKYILFSLLYLFFRRHSTVYCIITPFLHFLNKYKNRKDQAFHSLILPALFFI